MIHFLQCLWWEWRWHNARKARKAFVRAIPLEPRKWRRAQMTHHAQWLEREMARLEALMFGGGR
jgi:hypothetical protein